MIGMQAVAPETGQATGREAEQNLAQVSSQDLSQDLVRVAILDSSAEFGENLSDFIGASLQRFQVVLIARTWPELVESYNFPARLILLDADADERVSVEARIRACRATGALVFATTASAEGTAGWELVKAAVERAGAKAVVSKQMTFSDIIGVFGSIAVPLAAETRVRPALPKLSAGETSALTLYTAGKTVSEVGAVMNVRYETAKTYLRRVREKYALLGRAASSRADLISRAREDGFLS